MEQTKRCARCKRIFPLTEFHKHSKRKDGLQDRCRSCARAFNRERYYRNPEGYLAKQRAYRQQNPEQVRLNNIKGKWGLNRAEYLGLVAHQRNQCAICGASAGKRALHLDHNHETGEVRGLLCGSCNNGLGSLRDDPDLLRRASEYIRHASTGLMIKHIAQRI